MKASSFKSDDTLYPVQAHLRLRLTRNREVPDRRRIACRTADRHMGGLTCVM